MDIMKIEHTALYVSDLESVKSFFTTYFEARAGTCYYNNVTGFRSYFLSFADGARLEIMNRPGVKINDGSGERTGYTHIAFSTGSRESVDTLTARLAADGYRIVSGPRVTGDGYYESCVSGPEQNLIEITV